MNKAELIAQMAAKAGLSKADAEKALIAFTVTVGETLLPRRRFPWLDSELSKQRTEPLEKAETLRPARLFRFRLL